MEDIEKVNDIQQDDELQIVDVEEEVDYWSNCICGALC